MVLPNRLASKIKKVCPYQMYNIYNDNDHSGLYSEEYLDSDNLCSDLQYLREYRDSDGNDVEYFGKNEESNYEYIIFLAIFLIVIYLINV